MDAPIRILFENYPDADNKYEYGFEIYSNLLKQGKKEYFSTEPHTDGEKDRVTPDAHNYINDDKYSEEDYFVEDKDGKTDPLKP